MAGSKSKLTEPIPRHRVLREVIRHFIQFEEYVSKSGQSVIHHGYYIYPAKGKRQRVLLSISFWDLHNALQALSERKREAVFYNVILDWKQKDVAEMMGITTVSVGQYVEQAVIQLSEVYFAEEKGEEEDIEDA